MLVVEDIHWPDASSLELLLHLARRTDRERLFLLLTYRGDEVHPDLEHFLATLDRERLGNEIRLDRLDAGQVALMLQTIFGVDAPVPADLLHAIYALTEGNPFLHRGSADRPLARNGRVVAADGGWSRDELHLSTHPA